MKIARLHVLLFIIILLLTPGTQAQTPYMKQISLFKGKESYTVTVVYQDKQGWIWFGTDRGLFRYDGINLNHYTVNDSLASDHITAIGAESSGSFWIGHKDGEITRYENSTFYIFRPEEGLGSVEITDFVSDSNKDVWYSTLGEGIFKYDGRHIGNLNKDDDGLSDDYVYDIEVDGDGKMWMATDYGISMYFKNEFKVISMRDGLPDNIVRVVKSDPAGNILLGSEENGIAIYKPATNTITEITGWEFGAVTGITTSLSNELWISTRRNGIIILNYDTDASEYVYQQLTDEQGLISNRLTTVIKDQENNIWIAGRDGVVQSLPPVFEFLNESNGTPFSRVFSFTIDLKGNYWVCSDNALFKATLDKYGGLNWSTVSEKVGLAETNFISLYTSTDGYVWAGTYGSGVYKFKSDGSLLKNYTTSDGLKDENVINISGNESHIWFSTLGGGVSMYDIKLDKIRTVNDPYLNNSYVYAAIEDNNNKTWIAGSFSAPAYLFNDKFSLVEVDSSMQYAQLYGIAIDAD
ncbi:two-component regulator propeller domain-containing protein, partial [Bacteroidota bacterium]